MCHNRRRSPVGFKSTFRADLIPLILPVTILHALFCGTITMAIGEKSEKMIAETLIRKKKNQPRLNAEFDFFAFAKL